MAVVWLKFAISCTELDYNSDGVRRRPPNIEMALKYAKDALDALSSVPANDIPYGLLDDTKGFAANPLAFRLDIEKYHQAVFAGVPIAPPDEPHIIIARPENIKIHPQLALSVLNLSEANAHRAYAMWTVIRAFENPTGIPWYSEVDIISFFAKETGKHRRTIRRWLAAGDDLFFDLTVKRGKRVIFLRGKKRVLDAFNIGSPGRVAIMPSAKAFGDLQPWRSSLYQSRLGTKSQWASRDTLKQLTGVNERTQRNYDQVSDTEVMPVYTEEHRLEYIEVGNKVRQLPNRYLAAFERVSKKNGKQFDLRVAVNSAEGNHRPNATNGVEYHRVFFDDPKKASRSVGERAGEGGEVFVACKQTHRGGLWCERYVIS